LHVLSTPPAFVLSQDQTLQKESRRSVSISPPGRGRSWSDRQLVGARQDPEGFRRVIPKSEIRRRRRRSGGPGRTKTGFVHHLVTVGIAGRGNARKNPYGACCSVFKERDAGRPATALLTKTASRGRPPAPLLRGAPLIAGDFSWEEVEGEETSLRQGGRLTAWTRNYSAIRASVKAASAPGDGGVSAAGRGALIVRECARNAASRPSGRARRGARRRRPAPAGARRRG
jgi:hypothetical protein